MNKIILLFCLILLLGSSISCNKKLEPETLEVETKEAETKEVITVESNTKEPNTTEPNTTEQLGTIGDYNINNNGDLEITIGEQRTVLNIDALPDNLILEDEKQRLLILTDPTSQYQHGILGDDIEASSVTIVQLSDQPKVISKFSVPEDWVIESILPIWSDWDGDGVREVVLTLSNNTSGAKLVLYDENGNLLAESLPIGKGFRWRHALTIASFGENGQKLLVDVQTPHIGGIVGFYSWDKEEKLLRTEASLPGYSTHDIGSRSMEMYTLLNDEFSEQVLLILPNQSKTELAALRINSGTIDEEWRIPIGGTLSGNLELIDENGVHTIRAIIDNNQEVLLKLPE